MDKKITVYSTGCPKCKVLIQKLNDKNIPYIICDDIDVMMNKGLRTVPVVEKNGELMSFKEAVKWVNDISDKKG